MVERPAPRPKRALDRWTRPIACLLSGLALAYASPGFQLFGHATSALAFVALVPLLALIPRQTPLQRLKWGWVTGLIAFFISMNWVIGTMQTYGGLPLPLAVLVALLLAGYLGIYVGLFAVVCGWFSTHRIPLVVAAPLLWVVLEWVRTYAMTGLPWNLLGLSVYQYESLIQLADLTGIYGVSWLVMFVNACLFALIQPLLFSTGGRQGYFFNHMVLLLMAPVCVAAYGQVKISALKVAALQQPDTAPPIQVALVQPNIPQQIKWRPEALAEIVTRMEQMTTDTREFAPDLIIWPEASLPLVLDRSPRYRQRIERLTQQTDSHLLLGSIAPTNDGHYLNSVYLIAPDGSTVGQVAKRHLVPFGEYVPLGALLGFVRKISDGIGDIVPGPAGAILSHPKATIGVAVCYEVIFPALVRDSVRHGANLIVTVTNDAWFGTSAAPEQHLANAVFRAVENRSVVLRAANTGISAVIDPFGTISQRTDLNEQDTLHAQVTRRQGDSFYTRHGDAPLVVAVVLLAVLALWGRLRRYRKPVLENDD